MVSKVAHLILSFPSRGYPCSTDVYPHPVSAGRLYPSSEDNRRTQNSELMQPDLRAYRTSLGCPTSSKSTLWSLASRSRPRLALLHGLSIPYGRGILLSPVRTNHNLVVWPQTRAHP
jgi:hypothetical protein